MIYSTEYDQWFAEVELLDDWIACMKDDIEEWDQSPESLGLVTCKWVPFNKSFDLADRVDESYFDNTEDELEKNKLTELVDAFDAWVTKHNVGWWEPTKEKYEYTPAPIEVDP